MLSAAKPCKKICIVIPTFRRCDLLERNLSCLANANMPPEVESVIVAENGERTGAENLLKKFSGRLPLQYRFTSKPNKSNALNQILMETRDEFILFFDD